VAAKAEEDDSTPWKGKSSAFFAMKQAEGPPGDALNPANFELN
jgi:hypothetical protein